MYRQTAIILGIICVSVGVSCEYDLAKNGSSEDRPRSLSTVDENETAPSAAESATVPEGAIEISEKENIITESDVPIEPLQPLIPPAPSVAPCPTCKVVFAHMVNTIEAVDWAIAQGANGVEVDLRFNPDGNPSVFRHGFPCDCNGGYGTDSVCAHLGPTPCRATTDAATLLNHIATKQDLAVVYIDSKVDSDDAPSHLSIAGNRVINFVDEHLFRRGFRGQVIISTPSTTQIDYTRGAIAEAERSWYRARYYFTIDGESQQLSVFPSVVTMRFEFERVMSHLVTLTENRVYATGITRNYPRTYYDQIALAAFNKRRDRLASAGIWTIDSVRAMDTYLNYGADAIMTNRPFAAIALVRGRGLRLAGPGEALWPSRNNTRVERIAVGEVCESNDNCQNDTCGRGTAAEGAMKVCCPSGRYGNYAGFDYCYGMVAGSVCWSDAMCRSGNCRGNWGGLRRGQCD